MDALGGARPPVSKAQSIAISSHSTKAQAADLLLVVGPEMPPQYVNDFKLDAFNAGVDIEIVGDGVNGIDLTVFSKLRAGGRIGPNTQKIIMCHGNRQGDAHVLRVEPGKDVATKAVLDCIRDPAVDPSQQTSAKETTTNLVCCWAREYAAKQAPTAEPVIAHGDGDMLTELGNESISSLIFYIGECKRQNIPIEPLGMFDNAAKTTVEDLTLASGELKRPLRVEGPEDANLSLPERLSGDPLDIARMNSSRTHAWPPVRRPGAPPLLHDLMLRLAKRGRDDFLMDVIRMDPTAVNASSRHGTAPLWTAASESRSDAVICLLQNKANVNAAHRWKGSPLILACDRNDRDVVRLLVGAGADVNLQDGDGNTPLHFACRTYLAHSPSDSIVEFLLKANAKPDIRNKKGESPLSLARASQDSQTGQGGKPADLVALLEGASKPTSSQARL